jgi:hypothetical protein
MPSTSSKPEPTPAEIKSFRSMVACMVRQFSDLRLSRRNAPNSVHLKSEGPPAAKSEGLHHLTFGELIEKFGFHDPVATWAMPSIRQYQERLERQESLNQSDAVQLHRLLCQVPAVVHESAQFVVHSPDRDAAQDENRCLGEYLEAIPGILRKAASVTGANMEPVVEGVFAYLDSETTSDPLDTCEPSGIADEIQSAWMNFRDTLPPDPDGKENARLYFERYYGAVSTTPTPSQSEPVLEQTDIDLLTELASKPGVSFDQYGLATAIDRDRKTVGKRLEYLRNVGYVAHPPGKKRGNILTEAGETRLKATGESSP